MSPESYVTTPANLDAPRASIYESLHGFEEFDRYLSSKEVHASLLAICEEFRQSPGIKVGFEPLWSDPEDRESGKPADFQTFVIELSEPTEDEEAAYHEGLIIGGVHSNERIWTRTFPVLARILCKQPELMRLVGCKRLRFLDADPHSPSLDGDDFGANGNFNLVALYKGSFRSHLQPENELRAEHENYAYRSRLPGSKAIERAIEQYRPDFVDALHNTSIGGWFAYVNRMVSEIGKDIMSLAGAIRPPLPVGAPDSPEAQELSQGFYATPTVRDRYERYGPDSPMVQGNNSRTYQADIVGGNSLGVNYEAPYLISQEEEPRLPPGITAARHLRANYLPLAERMVGAMGDILKDVPSAFESDSLCLLRDSTDFLHGCWVNMVAKAGAELRANDTKWTVTEFATINIHYLALSLGQAYRLAASTGRKGLADKAEFLLLRAAQVVEELLRPQAAPPRSLVAFQAGAALLSLLALKEEKGHDS